MFIKKSFQLLLTSAYLFYKDKLYLRSNAIAYSIIVAIIPSLTIIIKFANIDEKKLIENLSRLFTIYGITSTQPLIDIIQDILNRTNTISGIGLIFLLYSFLNIFAYLEDSANQIFRAKTRGFLLRTSIFTTWVVFLPLIFIFLFDLSSSLKKFLTPVNYIKAGTNENNNILLLKDNYILESYSHELEFQNDFKILEKVDFYALNRKIVINEEEMLYDISGDIVKSFLKEPKEFIVDNDFMLITALPSIIFFTKDNGLNWDYRFFIFSNKGKSFDFPIIEDVKKNKENLYFLLTYGNQSYLLILDKNYFEVQKKFLFQKYYNLLYIENNKIYLVGQDLLTYSDISKWNWESKDLSVAHNIFESVYVNNDSFIFLTKNKRILLYDIQNESFEYPSIRINHLENIKGLQIFNHNSGFLFGKKEFHFVMRLNENQTLGKEWFIARFYDENNREVQLETINDILIKDDFYLLLGENKSYYQAKIFSISTDRKTDLKLIKFKIIKKHEIENYKKIFPEIIYNVINYFYILIFFTFFYMILPNCKIAFLSAFIGSIFSSLGIILSMIIFNLILPFFTTSKIIYGIWFAVPISMVVLLSTIQIFLFGLEIVRVHMNPDLLSDKIFVKFKSLLFGDEGKIDI